MRRKAWGFKSPLPHQMLLDQAVSRYIDELSLLRRDSTINRATQILNEFCSFSDPTLGTGSFATKALADLTRYDVLYFTKKVKDRTSDRTSANYFIRVKAMLEHHKIKHLVTMKDCPKFVEPDVEIYSDDQLKRFFGFCNLYQLGLFKTLLMCGLREQEAVYLERSDIRNGVLHITAKPHYGWNPKTWENRCIPVPAALKKILDEVPNRGELIFATENGTPQNKMWDTVKRVARKARLDETEFWLHKFRSTCLTHLLRRGVDPRTVMKIAGHHDMASTLRYLRPMEGQELQDKFNAAWAV